MADSSSQDENTWALIRSFFARGRLVCQNVDSYNRFYRDEIPRLVEAQRPIDLLTTIRTSNHDPAPVTYRYVLSMEYLGPAAMYVVRRAPGLCAADGASQIHWPALEFLDDDAPYVLFYHTVHRIVK